MSTTTIHRTEQVVAAPEKSAQKEVSLLRTLEDEKFLDGVRRLAVGRAVAGMIEVAFGLGLFTRIQGRSVTLAELGDLVGLPPASARLMAQFLCQEGLLTYRDGKLTNHPFVDKHLASDTLVRKEISLLNSFPWPVEELRARLLAPPEQPTYQSFTDEDFYYIGNPRRVAWGEQLTLIYDFKPHRVLLDVAGASGGYCIGIRRHHPHLRCLLFDLPKTEPFAVKVIADAGMSDSISFHGGSFLTDELPRGADVALIANVLQDWRPDEVVQILRRTHDALEPGGTVLVNEDFFEDDWTGSMRAVFQAFFVGRNGWQPAYGEMEPLMTAAGFAGLERRPNLLVGRKKA